MNILLQNILVISALVLAIVFLVKKFFWKTPKTKKACGNDDCGCH
ncbi:FeoB-associated Cys-rich membrane protein [Flavobacteriaceae bacterium GSB9]|nr:FeoB-associated Cys-rich membrane protein [Flavobacteriaceae bacterium GSB9]